MGRRQKLSENHFVLTRSQAAVEQQIGSQQQGVEMTSWLFSGSSACRKPPYRLQPLCTAPAFGPTELTELKDDQMTSVDVKGDVVSYSSGLRLLHLGEDGDRKSLIERQSEAFTLSAKSYVGRLCGCAARRRISCIDIESLS